MSPEQIKLELELKEKIRNADVELEKRYQEFVELFPDQITEIEDSERDEKTKKLEMLALQFEYRPLQRDIFYLSYLRGSLKAIQAAHDAKRQPKLPPAAKLRPGRKTNPYVAKRNELMRRECNKEPAEIATILDKAKLYDEYIKDRDSWLIEKWRSLQKTNPRDKSLQSSASYTKAISFPWLMEKFERLIREARQSRALSRVK